MTCTGCASPAFHFIRKLTPSPVAGRGTPLTSFLLVDDRGDAHGLSIAIAASHLALNRGYRVTLHTAMLGEVYLHAPEIYTAAVSNEHSHVLITDLPLPGHDRGIAEKTAELYGRLAGKGIEVVFVDHHPMPDWARDLLLRAHVKVNVFQSGKAMTDFLLSLWGAEDDPFAREVMLAGNAADIDCEALRSGADRELAKGLDVALRRYGFSTALAGALTKGLDWLRSLASDYPASKLAKKILDKARVISRDVILVDYRDVQDVMSSGWFNKAVNEILAEGKAKYVVVARQRMDSRISRYTSAIMVYTDPCGDVRTRIQQMTQYVPGMKSARVVGHKSFAIAILEDGESMDELMPADRLLEIAEDVARELS